MYLPAAWSGVRAAFLLVIVAVLLGGCLEPRTVKAAQGAPIPSGWIDRSTSKTDRPGGVPDVTLVATYPATRNVTDLYMAAWTAFDDQGWNTELGLTPFSPVKDPPEPWGEFSGFARGGSNDGLSVLCVVNWHWDSRPPGSPIVLACRFSARGHA